MLLFHFTEFSSILQHSCYFFKQWWQIVRKIISSMIEQNGKRAKSHGSFFLFRSTAKNCSGTMRQKKDKKLSYRFQTKKLKIKVSMSLLQHYRALNLRHWDNGTRIAFTINITITINTFWNKGFIVCNNHFRRFDIAAPNNIMVKYSVKTTKMLDMLKAALLFDARIWNTHLLIHL